MRFDLRQLWRDEDGTTSGECAVVIALFALAGFAWLHAVGGSDAALDGLTHWARRAKQAIGLR